MRNAIDKTWSQVARNLESSITDFISEVGIHIMPDDGDGDVAKFISENFPQLAHALEDYSLKVVGDKDHWRRFRISR